jgi:hypothetical protein
MPRFGGGAESAGASCGIGAGIEPLPDNGSEPLDDGNVAPPNEPIGSDSESFDFEPLSPTS